MLLAAIGTCTGADVDYITSRRAEPTGFEITVDGDKVVGETGNVMENLRVTFAIAFPPGDDGDVAREFLPPGGRPLARPAVDGVEPHDRERHADRDRRRLAAGEVLFAVATGELDGHRDVADHVQVGVAVEPARSASIVSALMFSRVRSIPLAAGTFGVSPHVW